MLSAKDIIEEIERHNFTHVNYAGKNKHGETFQLLNILVTDYEKLQAENKKLREALEFYSDIDEVQVVDEVDGKLIINEKHSGKLARKTLAEIKIKSSR